MDTMDGIDKNGLLNGQWTMDDGRWAEIMSRPYRADSNIADPTDPASCLLQRRAFGHRKANINHNRDGYATF
jgi:hypothetical protein